MDLPLSAISKLYGLNLAFVEEVSGGFLSNNYALTDGNKKYFLKKHRYANKDQVEGVCLAEQFFAGGNVPVILPIRNQTKQLFFAYQSGFYSLYPFVDGRHIKRGKLTERAAVSLGQMLAILHRRGKQSILNISEQFSAWDTDEFLAEVAAIEAIVHRERPLSEFGALTLESLRMKKRAVLEERIQYDRLGLANDHLIHGDYFCDNAFFGENDRVTYVFDFEKVQYAPPPYELCRSVFVNFFSVPSQKNLSLAKKYMSAYLEVYTFQKEVIRNSLTAAYQKQMQSLWIEGEHYLKHNTRADELLPSQYACNRYYVQNRKEVEAYLLG